jgi:hypothetical protein
MGLPDVLLLKILQCCAADASPYGRCSLLSLSRANSKLQQAAQPLLDSIVAGGGISDQHKADSILLYLGKHAKHVSSMSLRGDKKLSVSLNQLPTSLQLTSLWLERLQLRAQPTARFRGVLGAAAGVANLKQLRLSNCNLIGKSAKTNATSALLSRLPAGLEQLSIRDLRCGGWVLEIPTGLLQRLQQLTSLKIVHNTLKGPDDATPALQPLQALTRLVELQLKSCKLLGNGGDEDLAATLTKLMPGLKHLSISGLTVTSAYNSKVFRFPTAILQQQQQQLQLTHVELAEVVLLCPDAATAALQPLQDLTRLVDLRLGGARSSLDGRITASILSGLSDLTHLELYCSFEPGVLDGKTKLQHLECSKPLGSAAGAAQLLSQLQHMQQLTHLGLRCSLKAVKQGSPPATAYSALTASSHLQHLTISECELPAGVWQHVFPAGRQLPHLRSLNISPRPPPRKCIPIAAGEPPSYGPARSFESSCLVSCCPGLQCLDMKWLGMSTELLAPLQGLSGMQELLLAAESELDPTAAEGLAALCQLTGLRALDLRMFVPETAEERLLLQLTQLKQLTELTYRGPLNAKGQLVKLSAEVSCSNL